MEPSTTVVETQMLIRKPVREVFDAFINPDKTRNFWFTKASSHLVKGQTVTWEWEMYNVSAEVNVIEVIDNKWISLEWGEPKTTVDFNFTVLSEDSTYVVIRNYGFAETGADLLNVVKDVTGGFTTVLDGLKAYLEHNINLNLIADKFPKELSFKSSNEKQDNG
ncbi:MAG TPA: SRPBCC family protein [Flavobacterium sp.]|jgi:uncharacterized protein YndB with AHSA1/START domain|nr:SRPBCC family protein [Flavobacterium sp.]